MWKDLTAFMLSQPQAGIPQLMDHFAINRKAAYHLQQLYQSSALHSGHHSLYAQVVALYTDAEVQKAQQHLSSEIANSERTLFCATMLPVWRANLHIVDTEMQKRRLQALLPIETTRSIRLTPIRLRKAA